MEIERKYPDKEEEARKWGKPESLRHPNQPMVAGDALQDIRHGREQAGQYRTRRHWTIGHN